MMYEHRCPCLTCTVKITQVGISEVVYSHGYNMDTEVSLHREQPLRPSFLANILTSRALRFSRRRVCGCGSSAL